MILEDYITNNKKKIEDILMAYMNGKSGREQIIYEAMAYSLMAGGKRLRPMILMEVYKLFASDEKAIHGFIAAIEMVHTYSLIHDDLPAMDDDATRRGLATCHIKFGEDIAILAGDGLLNMAFELMAESTLTYDLGKKGLKALACLGKKAGTRGMVGGQVVDIINENKIIDLPTVEYIHANKTAALIEASFMMGGYLGGASDETIKSLEKIGHDVGMAFQIQDDLLDVISTEEMLGKPINSDEKNSKTTYVTIKGIEEAKADVSMYLDQAKTLLMSIPVENTTFITSLIEHIRYRES